MKEIYAYLAGVLDSDGTIGVKKSTYKMRVTKDCTKPTYSERICVRQVENQAVALIQKTFGGGFYITKPSALNGKPLFTVALTDKKASAMLEKLLPFLRIKKQQALNCLKLRKTKDISNIARRFKKADGTRGRSNRDSNAMERLYQKSKTLNSVGREKKTSSNGAI
jgi:hypothetical protein